MVFGCPGVLRYKIGGFSAVVAVVGVKLLITLGVGYAPDSVPFVPYITGSITLVIFMAEQLAIIIQAVFIFHIGTGFNVIAPVQE